MNHNGRSLNGHGMCRIAHHTGPHHDTELHLQMDFHNENQHGCDQQHGDCI